eukprot:scaffold172_cov254-Pinguiococcus_pyrenoidosus.AAC.11
MSPAQRATKDPKAIRRLCRNKSSFCLVLGESHGVRIGPGEAKRTVQTTSRPTGARKSRSADPFSTRRQLILPISADPPDPINPQNSRPAETFKIFK